MIFISTRYFIFLLPTKKNAKQVLKLVSIYLADNLKLTLNYKSRYFPSYLGIDFCGYHIYETHILLRKRFKKNLKRKIKFWYKLKCNNKFLNKKYLLSLNSFKGHASHSNSYNFISKIERLLEELK